MTASSGTATNETVSCPQGTTLVGGGIRQFRSASAGQPGKGALRFTNGYPYGYSEAGAIVSATTAARENCVFSNGEFCGYGNIPSSPQRDAQE